MLISESQQELRTVYDGGLYGQLVSGMVWLLSAALASWYSSRSATIMLVIGGFFIFPLTTLVLRIKGRKSALNHDNPFRYLAIQTAFVLPLSMPLLVPVVAYRSALFYPAMMILLGAHYLPFGTLYGMRSFIGLAAVLIAGGITLAMFFSESFPVGGWLTGALLLLFAFVGRWESDRINN
jgi:hypothetical protein